MGFSVLEHWDMDIVRQCIEVGRKKRGLGLLEEFLTIRFSRKDESPASKSLGKSKV
jgi:hypothetical protein